MTPTTRFLCPLDCGWHHDSRDLPDLAGLSGETIEEIIRAGIERSAQADETAVREHLETHPLIEWVTEVARLQRELNRAVAVRGSATVDDFPWWNRPGVLQAEELHLPPGPRLTGIVMDPGDVAEVDGDVPLPIPATPVGASAATANAEGHSVGSCSEAEGFCDAHGYHRHPAEAPDCRWPACLSEDDQQLLAEQVGASMLGEETALMPDPQPGCGCVDRGVGRAWVAGGPDCGFPSVPPRKHSAELQQQVAERFGFPLRTPATGGEQQ